MPNHFRNRLSVIGPEAKAFAEKAKGSCPRYAVPLGHTLDPENEPVVQDLCFNQLLPVPDGLIARTFGAEMEKRAAEEAGNTLDIFDGCVSGYEWQSLHWGTKWGAYDQDSKWIEDGVAQYDFTTAWGPPTGFVVNVSKQYPDMTFIISYGGEGPCAGRFVVRAGVLIRDEAADPGTTPDYPEECNSLYGGSELSDNEKERLTQLEQRHDEACNTWVNQYIDSHFDEANLYR